MGRGSETVSIRELGSAPVRAATRILVIAAPRGMITLSRIGTQGFPWLEFARSKTSAKKVNMELEASLQWKGYFGNQVNVGGAIRLKKMPVTVTVKHAKELNLCCTVTPTMEQSTKQGNTGDGQNKWGQYRRHLDANKKQSSTKSGREVKSWEENHYHHHKRHHEQFKELEVDNIVS